MSRVTPAALLGTALLLVGARPAAAQELGRRLASPAAPTPDEARARSADGEDAAEDEGTAPDESPAEGAALRPDYAALSAVSFALAAISIPVLIGAQVRLNDIANDPEWLAARVRFPAAENICEVDGSARTQDFCAEADTLEALTAASIIIGAVGLVSGLTFLIVELSTSTEVSGAASATGGALRLRHRF